MSEQNPQTAEGERRVTRHALVVGAAGAVAVGLASEASTAIANADESIVVGTVTRQLAGNAAVLSAIQGGEFTIRPRPDALLTHGVDDQATGMGSFIPGEEVIVLGVVAGSEIDARVVGSVYTGVTGVVRGLTDGSFEIAARTRTISIPASVKSRYVRVGGRAGDACRATVWTHPQSGSAFAATVWKA